MMGLEKYMQTDQVLRKLTYAQALLEGMEQAMELDPAVVVIGEGVPDPKAIFGTTEGLCEQFGAERVFDMPLAENGMTGICIGAAMNGLRPVMVHQRIDFAMLAMDQLINNAAKWHFMFDGKTSVPLVVRLIIGRGWGQGPQHSQSLQALFAHIPGLKVVMPATARDAKGMLIAAIQDNNPVIFIEHRWLHHIEDAVPENLYVATLNKANIIRKGCDVTVVASSLMVIEALRAANVLECIGISVEIVDLRSVRPIDIDTIMESVFRTKNLIVADTAWKVGGISGEIVAQVMDNGGFSVLERAPLRIASPDHPVPTSHYMANNYYQDAEQIAQQVLNYLEYEGDRALVAEKLRIDGQRDVPFRAFHGPF